MKVRHYLLLAAVAFSLIGSVFLPNVVAAVMDSRQLDNLIMIDSQSISFAEAPELSLPERIALVASPETDILPLKTGNFMDFDTAKNRANDELIRFFRDSPFQFDFSSYRVEEDKTELVIDTTVHSLNMIVWEFVLIDDFENTVIVSIDDETGTILKLIYRLGSLNRFFTWTGARGLSDDDFYSTAESLAEMMREYYELPIILADYHLSGSIAYYKANLFGQNRLIPMFGVVRATSFTINERI